MSVRLRLPVAVKLVFLGIILWNPSVNALRRSLAGTACSTSAGDYVLVVNTG